MIEEQHKLAFSKKISIAVLIVTCTLAVFLIIKFWPKAEISKTMDITSLAFSHNQTIPSKYTCDGENISPPLSFEGVPENAKSLVLLMDDPDVPAAAGVRVWDHWVVFNIPPDTREIPAGQNPVGVLGSNTFGRQAYGGPCPPDREHRYFFKLYALDDVLPLPAGATKAEVEAAMQEHILEQAELIGLYAR